jgi:hypothetical protein
MLRTEIVNPGVRCRSGVGWATLVVLVASAGACNKASENTGGEPIRAVTSALNINTPLPSGNDVKNMSFVIQRVSCDDGSPHGDAITRVKPLEDQAVPGGAANLQNSPLDKGSAHVFADLFEVVEPGCYDVTTTPLSDGEPSKDCATAFKKKVVVNPGQTTEIFLINQCKGMDKGAIDVISALNHAPVLDDARFNESKFTCGSPVELCAHAHDVDGDPLELEVKVLAGKCKVTPEGSPAGMPMAWVRQCFTITCEEPGKAELQLSVYDQLWAGGALKRIEDWLADEGYPNDSHARLTLPAYFDGTKVYPDADGDGHGDAAAAATLVCGDVPAGSVTTNDDCNDGDAAINPDAKEICKDNVDNNCNGKVDEDCNQCQKGLVCGEFGTNSCACNGPFGSDCGKTPEGDPVCFAHFFCNENPSCSSSSECPDGRRCIIDTCCGAGRCAPNTCDAPAPAALRVTPLLRALGNGPRSDG